MLANSGADALERVEVTVMGAAVVDANRIDDEATAVRRARNAVRRRDMTVDGLGFVGCFKP
jgi:hypothetical protein